MSNGEKHSKIRVVLSALTAAGSVILIPFAGEDILVPIALATAALFAATAEYKKHKRLYKKKPNLMEIQGLVNHANARLQAYEMFYKNQRELISYKETLKYLKLVEECIHVHELYGNNYPKQYIAYRRRFESVQPQGKSPYEVLTEKKELIKGDLS